jgi:hypothetical protein
VFTAALVATAAAFSSAQVPLMIEVPDSGHIVRVGDFHPRQALGDLDFDGGVTPSRRNAIKVFGRPDGKDPRGCPNKWKSIGLRMLAANFGGGSQCASSTRIQKLYAKGPNWQTERGLKIGDSLDRVRELYPELMSYREWLDTSRREYRNHWVLVFEPSEINGPPGVERLSAEIRGRKVVSLTVSPYGAGD